MDFASRLRALMAERGMSTRVLAREVPCDHSYVSKLTSGAKRPSEATARRLDSILDASGELAALAEEETATRRRDALKLALAAPLAPEMLDRMIREAAADALEFTRLAATTAVGHAVIDQLESAVAAIGYSYCTQPPDQLFPVAHAYRARVAELVSGPCTLAERRDLYVCAGWLSELLAWMSHDLGHPMTAGAYARDAFEHAEQAGHGELCAWAADAMSSIALYTGQARQAADAAAKGITVAPAGHPLGARLRGQAARAHARLGQRGECEAMLTSARDAYDRLPARPPERDGADTGILASYAVTAYPASCYVWLGDYRQAEDYGRQAVEVHETAPEGSRSPSREAIARIDLAIAVTAQGSPDEGSALGRQALSSARVVNSVRSRAGDLDAMLGARYPQLPAARAFREQYRALTALRPAITRGEGQP